MLSSGSRLGSYELIAPLGAGGMGEVYRARDLKLGREVAIKVLPDLFAGDPDRLARFQREAQVLASLNHPNIAAIHGLEESGGHKALILELVPGETLADRIAHGPIPVDEALHIAKQIATAIEAAHEQGIIHRDLKPANVKVTPDGVVKVLDFGLAKLNVSNVSNLSNASNASNLSISPTLTSPVLMTGVGVLLGTAPYMAPEQAKGREADKRSDVWAYGCVLFEMLTGKRPFDGDDVAETLASVLKGEPDWSLLPANVPTPVVVALRRCLTKDPTRRLTSMSGVSFVLADAEALALPPPPAASHQPAASLRPLQSLVVAIALVIVGGASAWTAWKLKPEPQKAPQRFELAMPDGVQLLPGATRSMLAISPDGRNVAFGASGRLFLKTPDRPTATAIAVLAGSAGANPFFSPDGLWLGFSQGGRLRKVSVSGGAPIEIVDVGSPPLGLTWTTDDSIVFSRGPQGIWSVPASGGTPTKIITVDSKTQIALGPQVLPGGDDVLFTLASAGENGRTTGWDNASIVVESLSSHRRQTLLSGGFDAKYVTSGHLIYARQGTVFAVPFDLSTKTLAGAPVPVLQGISSIGAGVSFGGQGGSSQLSVSSDGVLVYVAAETARNERTMAWVDRTGRELPVPIPPRALVYPRISPDGQRVALDIRDQNQDIWTWDVRREVLAPLTFDPAPDISPIWSPDGKRIAFFRSGKGLFWQLADGSGTAESLIEARTDSLAPNDFTRDESLLLYTTQTAGGTDLLTLDLATRTSKPLIADPTANEWNAELSPDNRWIAYQSDETGQQEIFVRPFPDVNNGKWTVSRSGGTRPHWSADGKELFYMGGGAQNSGGSPLMSVEVTTTQTFQAGAPRQVLVGPFYSGLASRTYDVTRDGQRFLVIKSAGNGIATGRLIMVENWFGELRRVAPVK